MGNLRLLLAVVAASIFSALITALAMGRGGESTPPPIRDSGQDLTQLNATLSELVRALEPIATRIPGQRGASESVQRTPIMGESEALQAIAGHLEELKGLVAAQAWQGSSGSAVELAAMGTRQADAEWQALSDLKQSLNADLEATRRSLYFLTPAMVLQRYGRPTRITVSNNGRVNWIYNSQRPGDPQFTVTFRFMDGYVIEVG